MGNQITAIAPAQILPLESYFNDLADYGKPNSLGSTRFLKVARSTHRDKDLSRDRVEVVVKVFAKHDSSLNLKTHENKLHDIKVRLHGVTNTLPFHKFWETDKAAYLVRQYVHFNLYDRLSTRPFLSIMEKRWIAFQLLKALEECHAKKIYHGDIKTENVLLTGWDWVLLTDFASFKPILLPADNPADYSFFFDTSRRRTCYIAPERFIEDSLPPNSRLSLTEAMDIFSLGCVIGELFTDGRQLFDLSQLLELCSKQGEYSPEILLKKISDKPIRRMIRHMIQRDPHERFKAEEYLKVYKEEVFPEYFYSFLHGYFKQFNLSMQLTPDKCIQKLYRDVEAILANLLLDRRHQDRETGYGDALVIILSAITSHLRLSQFASTKLQALEMMKRIARHISDECILERIVPYLVLLVKDKWPSVRAEAVRTLTYCLCLVRHLPRSDVNLFPEYILQSLVHIPSDREIIVKIAFAECVADLARTAHRFLELAQLQANQDADESSSVIMQYQVQGSYDSELIQLQQSIQSKIVHLLTDSGPLVKKALLRHSAGKLCQFFGPQRANEAILSHMITFLNDKTDWDLHAAFFESIVGVACLLGHRSLPILQPLVQQGLSSPEETVVCKTIAAVTSMTEGKLFDRKHLVKNVKLISPFLVHPNIWVRYEAVGCLCGSVRQMDEIDVECFVTPIVKPFFNQPVFQLNNELVVLSAIEEPVPRSVLDYLLKQPNLKEIYKRLKKMKSSQEEDGMVESIEPQLVPVFRRLQTLGLSEEHKDSLLELRDIILKQHFNKQLFAEQDLQQQGPKGVIDCKLLPRVVSRQKQLTYGPPRLQLPFSSTTSMSSRRTGSKQSSGSDSKVIGSDDWDRIFGSEPASRRSSSKPTTSLPTPIPSSTHPHKSHPPSTHHSGTTHQSLEKRGSGVASLGNSPKLSVKKVSPDVMSRSTEEALSREESKEEEEKEGKGRRMSGHKRSRSEGSSATTAVRVNKSSVNQEGGGGGGEGGTQASKREEPTSPTTYLPRQQNTIESTSCTEGLKHLLDYKQRQYAEDMLAMDNELVKNTFYQSSSRWTPKGQLVAHIHEHKDSINKVRVLLDSTVFATFSSDGTTKLWDVTKLEGRNLINKAKLSYTQLGGQIKTGVFCIANTAIAAASSNGGIHVFPIDVDKEKKPGTTVPVPSTTSTNRARPLLESYVDPAVEGQVVEMAHFTAGGQSVISYVTTKGRLCGLDLRSNETVWRLTNNPKFGLVLSMAVDPYENWVALGTSLGYHVVWDMRFQLPIRHWQHTGHQKPHVHAVHHLSPHPTDPPSLISSVSGNNEVSIWDMETATRRQMLWASPAPPFGEMTDKPHQQESVRGLTTCVFDDHPVILTGGTDRIVRLWDLRDPDRCSCVVKPKFLKKIQFDYQCKVIEGVEVTKEITQSMATSSGGGGGGGGSESLPPPPPEFSSHQHSHIDIVTDLSVVPYKNQQFIVSASRDGVLKLWK